MPFRAMIVGLVCAGLSNWAIGEERFPFRATVEVGQAEVRSGPGKDFYPTAKLQRGDEVEVYRRDPGGWFAIRPPGGSFSWVPADEIDPQGDDIGEVLHDGVPSLVGSSVRQDRDTSHVKLDRGEQVVILGSSRGGGDRWYKITPPSGEFRWIHASDLGMENRDVRQLSPRVDRAQQRRMENASPRAVETVFAKAIAPPPKEQPSEQWHAAPRETMHHVGTRGTGQHSRPSDVGGYEPRPGWAPPSGSGLAARKNRPSRRDQAEYGRSAYERPSRTVSCDAPGSVCDAGDALAQLNLALSEMVCHPRDRWSLTELRNRTKDVLRQAERPADRGRARRLLERIAQFEDVQNKSLDRAEEKLFAVSHKSKTPERRRPDPPAAKPTRHRPPEPVAKATKPKPKPSVLSSIDESQYDGAGRLVAMQRRNAGDPQYLLVDEHGLTRYYVTPAPGVKLRSYQNQFVGITGSRQEDGDLGKPHITAQRVKQLSLPDLQ